MLPWNLWKEPRLPTPGFSSLRPGSDLCPPDCKRMNGVVMF